MSTRESAGSDTPAGAPTESAAASATTHADAEPGPASHPHATHKALAVIVGAALLLIVLALAVFLGTSHIAPGRVLAVLTNGMVGTTPSQDDITTVGVQRLPRTVIALVAGMCLGLSGVLIQSLTRNPLADPGILGLNSGAAFAIAIAIVVFHAESSVVTLPAAFVGAFAVAVLIFFIGGSRSDRNAIARLTLAGLALGAVLSGIVSALTLINPEGYSVLLAWNSASLAPRGWPDLLPALPTALIGIVLALIVAPAMNSLALGDDVARSLGTPVTAVRAGALVAITLLAGSATAMAGPVSFVGLMIPHVVRAMVGVDLRWIASLSLLYGAVLVIAADFVGRIVLPNGEVPMGLVTAFLGAPALIIIARRATLARST